MFTVDCFADACGPNGDAGVMEKGEEAATGGEVIYVCFVARVASREPFAVSRISAAEWAAGAARCEALADQSEPKVAESLRRVARAYRAKAGQNE